MVASRLVLNTAPPVELPRFRSALCRPGPEKLLYVIMAPPSEPFAAKLREWVFSDNDAKAQILEELRREYEKDVCCLTFEISVPPLFFSLRVIVRIYTYSGPNPLTYAYMHAPAISSLLLFKCFKYVNDYIPTGVCVIILGY